ncbi:NAD-dependent protein deacetylase sirtuin-1 [Tiliqua scincoides]|uniref:NAD-dependent protein deacetylase sirtuin-1 n=1 Tax=Tiliqua scincoides TaxID=71010 RepID=UPI003461B085
MIGTDPRAILKDLLPETIPPPELDDMTLWQIVINILSEPPKRKKRKDINTIEDAVKLLQECKKIIVLTGAGVSVSCGIPDFRSRDGIYARLAVDFPDLPDPQAMFDIEYFRKDPRPFFKFAKEIYPGQFQPSLCHKFIALMDKERKLLRNYTQNIDTLEQVAGIQRIIQCHGSFATASCLICKYKVDCEAIRGDIFNQVVPRCPRCPPDEPLAIMKPEIVFFGENLPEQFHRAMKYDKDEADLLIVIGSSLKVRPVALIPSSIPHEVPQILINREPLPHLHFDVELLGDCDVIINELCHRLGGEYTKLCNSSIKLAEITEKPLRQHKEFEIHSAELPPTPLNISEYSSSPDRIAPQDSQVAHSELSSEYKAENSDAAWESKENCGEEKSQEVQNSLESAEKLPDQLENPENVKENGSNQGGNKERSERTSVETLRKCWINRCAKEQISKRLDGTQYLFLPPNRYIFHGAEVYSDSEDDVISSSSCGSSSDSGSCHSPSLDIEDESEIEEFYNGIEEDDAADREEDNGFGEDGIELQESVDESVSVNEAVGLDCSVDKL